MPIARVQLPDGRIGRFEVPEGTTPDQVISFASKGLPEPETQNRPLIDYSQLKTGTPAERDPGLMKTLFDQGLQGATFGFADEITDRMGAGIASLVTGEKYDDVLKWARSNSQRDLKQQMEQRPVASIAANIGGGLLTGGAAASTKAGTAIGNSLRTGGTAARIGKGALAGAASGAAYGSGTATEGNRIEGAEQGALLGGAFGAAVPAVGAAVSGSKNMARGFGARGADKLDESLSGIRTASNAAYQKMRDSGAVFSKGASQKIIKEIDDAVRGSGPLNKRIHGNSIAVLKDLRDLAKKGRLGLEELDQYRQLFGDMAGDIGNKPNARLAGIVKGTMDDALDSLDDNAFRVGSKEALEALKSGRAEYARARKFETIADIVKKSEGDPNYVKRELTKIVNNPKKFRGFSNDEKLALKQAARLSGPEAVMKVLGKFGFDPSRLGSGVGAMFGSAAGGVVGGVPGAGAVPAVGTAAKYGLKLSTRGKAEDLLRVIEQGGKAAARKTPQIPGGAMLPGTLGGTLTEKPPLRIDINPADARKAQGMQGGVSQTDLRGGTNNDRLEQYKAIPPDERDVLEDFGYLKPIQHKVQGKPDIRSSEGSTSRLPDLMYKIAMAESGGNPNARAKTSTASGLFQFTDGTWRAMVQKYGKETGLRIQDKHNPRAQAMMSIKLIEENKNGLQKALKREPTDSEIYLAHFAGIGGAKRLLRAPPGVPAARLIPKAATANRGIFFDKNRPRSVGEVIQLLSEKVR